MLDDEKIGRVPDDFWDLSSLIPKKTLHVPARRSVEAVELEVATPVDESNSTVIHRMIPPKGNIPKQEEYSEIESVMEPTGSLIHLVTVKKRTTSYPFYEEFYRDALRLLQVAAEPCEYVPFFSYSPQYNQLNEKQLAYYLWWREQARKGEFLKTDFSYLLLYVYELINLDRAVDTADSLWMLTEIWNRYHTAFPTLEGKLATWICDFGLLHGLPPATNVTSELVRKTGALMEYYIAMPNGDVAGCVNALLRYCTAYDYHTSKFAKDDNLPVFDTHISGALACAVAYYSEDGKMLSKLASEDSMIVRDAYAGALCRSEIKRRLEIRYCSFSRTNELRYLVGDIIKYAENKLRAWLGVKSRLSVYSLSAELTQTLDQYFEKVLSEPKRKTAKKEVRQEYDALYDLPPKPFSVSDAQQIEQASWETTNELLAAFGGEEAVNTEETVAAKPTIEKEMGATEPTSGFLGLLGSLAPFALAVLKGNTQAQREEAARLGKMPEAIVDEINAAAFDELGDILIEETEDGLGIIDCYRDVLINGEETK